MTSDEQHDPYDPVIAGRFELLDRLEPPAVPLDGLRGPQPRPVTDGDPGGNRRPGRALIGVAAAAVVVVALVGLTALAFTGDGDQGLEATDRGGASAGDERATGPVDHGGSIGATTSTPPPTSATTGPIVVEDTTVDEAGPGSTPSTETTVPPRSSLPPESVTPTTVPTTTELTTAPSTQGQDGQIITVTGVVTEVFTDCQSRLVLGESGQVEQVGPVSCDGGSHIIVDGRRIQTSAGFVPADAYYDKHPRDLQPGKTVVVTAISVGDGRLTLDCDPCGVGR